MSKASTEAHKRVVDILTGSYSSPRNEYICNALAREHPILFVRLHDQWRALELERLRKQKQRAKAND